MRTPNARVWTSLILMVAVLLVTASCTRSSTSPTSVKFSVTGLSPSAGPLAAGTSVVITGTGFRTGVTVTFDGIAATVVSVSSGAITVTAPAHAAGRVDVVVTNPGSGGSARLANGYNYLGLSITSISPTSSFANTDVRLFGSGFGSNTVVTFGGVQAQVVSLGGTFFTVRVPVRTTDGRVDVVVTNPGEEVALRDAFTYQIVTMTFDQLTVPSSGQINVSWTVSPGRSFLDWIGIFHPAASNLDYLTYEYTNGAVSGTVKLTAPSQPGQYHFRYLLDDGYVDVARTAVFTVAPAVSAFERQTLTRSEHESRRCPTPSKEASRSSPCPSIDLFLRPSLF